jgi:hypothetical protein
VLWALSGVGIALNLLKVPAERYRGRLVLFADPDGRLVPRVPQRRSHLHAQPAVGQLVDAGQGGCPGLGVHPDEPKQRGMGFRRAALGKGNARKGKKNFKSMPVKQKRRREQGYKV